MWRVILAFALLADLSSAEEPNSTVEMGVDSVEKPTVIPLEEVWGFWINGTTPVQKLFLTSEWKGDGRALLLDLQKGLRTARNGEEALLGFAVKGSPSEAFLATHAVIAKDAEPEDTFSTGDNVYAAIFACYPPGYLSVENVSLTRRSVSIEYRFVPHVEDEATKHFAIIPLGHLAEGEYSVDMKLLPLEKLYPPEDYGNWAQWAAKAETVRKRVSGPFKFRVHNPNVNERNGP